MSGRFISCMSLAGAQWQWQPHARLSEQVLSQLAEQEQLLSSPKDESASCRQCFLWLCLLSIKHQGYIHAQHLDINQGSIIHFQDLILLKKLKCSAVLSVRAPGPKHRLGTVCYNIQGKLFLKLMIVTVTRKQTGNEWFCKRYRQLLDGIFSFIGIRVSNWNWPTLAIPP